MPGGCGGEGDSTCTLRLSAVMNSVRTPSTSRVTEARRASVAAPSRKAMFCTAERAMSRARVDLQNYTTAVVGE